MKNLQMTLGQKIKLYRNLSKLTQKELSKKLGITQTHLSQIEKDKKLPSVSLIRILEKEMEVEPNNLLFNFKKQDNNHSERIKEALINLINIIFE